MKHAQDHFSSIAPQYAVGRIGYPEALYRFLGAQCHEHGLAWDCATGSGQAAVDLARMFTRVIATDISEELLALAPPHPRISYRAASAEKSGIESDSVDLVTVAQALHWFDLTHFWAEVMRVLKNGSVLAFCIRRVRSLDSGYGIETKPEDGLVKRRGKGGGGRAQMRRTGGVRPRLVSPLESPLCSPKLCA